MRTYLLSFLTFGSLLSGCSNGYPEITAFKDNPSDQFMLNTEGYAKLSVSIPYFGADSGCAHSGGHIHFVNEASPYVVDIYAVADGKVDSIDTCFKVGDNDRYGISLVIANSGIRDVTFEYGLEPMGGRLCSDGVDGADNGFFHPYILVTDGQEVKKGDAIAKMYRPVTGDTASHIHFNLRLGSAFACPNIFNDAVTAQYATKFGNGTCDGDVVPATFCFEPSEGEDLVGL